jgi:phosphatidylglycerophosphate synthase
MKNESIPDLATLRKLGQGDKLAGDRRPLYGFFRWLSSYLTWLLLRTSLTPNAVTAMSVAAAVLGTWLLAMPSPGIALCGALAFVVHHLLDKVDGAMARIRHQYSLAGVYLDELGHALAFAGIFAGLGLHLAWQAGGRADLMFRLMAAMIGALAMVLARQNKAMGFLLFAQNVLGQPTLLPANAASETVHPLSREAVLLRRSVNGGTTNVVGFVRDAVLLIADFSVFMLLLLAGVIVEVATGDSRMLQLLLVVEAALQCAVVAALVWINYTVNVESECRRLDEIVRTRRDSPRRD